MIKKVLLSLTVFACILLPKGIYASEETSSNAQMCGLEYQEPHVVDESVAKEYEAEENSQISVQSTMSELEVYAEMERRVKEGILNGSKRVMLNDLNIRIDTYSANLYFKTYSPYFAPEMNLEIWMMSESDPKILYISIDNSWTSEQTKQYFARVDAKLAFYQSLVNDSMSQVQKVLVIHDYIVSHSAYDETYTRTDCSGIFMDGVGVCQSYSMAYMYILNSLGIESYFVPCRAANHAWNLIRIDGQYYNVDCTFDDPASDVLGSAHHTYFLISDSAMTKLQSNRKDWDAGGRSCTSDAYADAFWRTSESPIVLMGNTSYYMKYEGYFYRSLIKRDNISGQETVLSEIDNRSAYQRYVQSGLFYNDGCLYYNTESQIIKYDLLNNTKYPVYELDPAMGYVRGCRLNGNVVEFSVYNSTSKGSTTYELVSEDGWKNLENGWYYIKNQKILKAQWLEDGGFTYYLDVSGRRMENTVWNTEESGISYEYRFDLDGHLILGWYEEGDETYYYYEKGLKCTGISIIEGETYYFDENGKMMRNVEITVDGVWYRFGTDGKLEWMITDLSDGWKQIGDNWYYVKDQSILKAQWLIFENAIYYLDEDGKMLENEECLLEDITGDGSHVYHFGSGGALITGWYQTSSGEWNYFDSNGLAVTGWLKLNTVWYYFSEDGVMETGWNDIDGTWYYFDVSGSMHTGWLQLNGIWYYMMPGGAMATGWAVADGNWYYFNESGSMYTGWLQLNGIWYYMMPSGAMATGWAAADGNWYYFNGSGSMHTGWLQLGNNWYYLQDSGNMVIGWQVVDGVNYYFNESGAWVS